MLMGSGAETAEETVEHLQIRGEKVGVVKVRLFRPFSPAALIGTLPVTVRSIAVLDRTNEPSADGEPLYKDVLAALAQDYIAGSRRFAEMPHVTGGRFGLSSKEFTPGMVKGGFDELGKGRPKNHFTIGIIDDISHSTSLAWDPAFRTDEAKANIGAVFYGLGSDGTVSAKKNSIKIIGEKTDRYVQGYFVYGFRKAGAVTVSHLRFGPRPIRSSYLIGDGEASFVACHQSIFLDRYEMLEKAKPSEMFLLNSQAGSSEAWDTLPRNAQRQIIEKGLTFHVIDAYSITEQLSLGDRINTIMQACFFAISGVLPRDEAIAAIKDAARETYARAGLQSFSQQSQMQ